MTEETPPGPQPVPLPPFVDWMSRHGWKILLALVVIELFFYARAVGAQTSGASVGGRPATVRVNVSVTIPRVAFVRQVVPLTIDSLSDGSRDVSFNVVVTANCRWRLSVRPRFPFRQRSVPRIEVQDVEGAWVRLDQAEDGVVVVPEHAPCTAEGVLVRMRLDSGDQVTALGRVQFDVVPIPE